MGFFRNVASSVFEPTSEGDILCPGLRCSTSGESEVIYGMTITTKTGKVIRRANGQPFRNVIRPKAVKCPAL
jgi:hypothetical protein